MADFFTNFLHGVEAPASNGRAVTPNDGADLAEVTRAVYVGGAGDLRVMLRGDTAPVTLVAVPAGTFCPLRVKRVHATGTTATGIVGLF